jgi:hypothetical protein
MDNPISFETKKQFVESKLPGVDGTDYIIKEMTNPAKDVSDYVSEQLKQLGDQSDLQYIKITHVAGGKDEDTTKLSFALKSAEKTTTTLVPNATVITSVEAIEPEITDSGSAMSATKVRKDTYKTFLNGTGFDGWSQQYKDFYGPMAQQIYNEILEPIRKYRVTGDQIQQYIDYGTLPSSKRKNPTGGSTKRKRKTQRRKRKTHHRRH